MLWKIADNVSCHMFVSYNDTSAGKIVNHEVETMVYINLANRNTDKALYNLKIGEQVADEYILNINSVLMHAGEPKLVFFKILS